MPANWKFNIPDHVNYYAWQEDIFNELECEAVMEIGEKQLFEQATIGKERKIYKKVRKGTVSWIPVSDETSWIYERVSNCINNLNRDYFKFDLEGFSKDFQFTKYKKNNFYDWHVDRGFGNPNARKLSFSIQLTNPKKYKGGDLVFCQGTKLDVTNHRKQGTIIAFPSFILHKVTPVTRGERNSLVGWSTGSNFK